MSIGVSGVLKFPTIIVLLLISPFIVASICCMYQGVPMLDSYIFVIFVSYSWIDPLVIMSYLSSSLVMVFILKST